MGEKPSILERVNRRPFGWMETQFYETVASGSVVKLVAPVILQQLSSTTHLTGDQRILDVGCGSGSLAQWIAEQTSTSTWGIDPSVSQMRRVARFVPLRVGAVAGAEALPFTDKSFGAVISSCSVKHWVDRAAGLAECRRVLRPNGTLVVVEIDGGQSPDDLLRFADASRVPRGLHRAYRAFAQRSFVPVSPSGLTLTEEMNAAGLNDVVQQRVLNLPFLVMTARRAEN